MSTRPAPEHFVTPAPKLTWQQALSALLLVELVLLGAYFDTACTMVEIWWRSETFNHAFLVPPIALWLIWEKRAVLGSTQVRPALWLALPFALLTFAWLLGELAAVNAASQFSFVALLILAVPLVLGLAAARQIAFPLLFLFFAVPFGEFVMPKLMDWTAQFTVLGLRVSGVPVYQEGLHFVIPSGRWSVIEACSGVRYLIASVVVGTLYAYLNYQSFKRRLIFVGFSILVPLLANWVRAYLTVMLGHLSNNQLAVGIDHLLYGWVFFGIVIAIMFAIGMRWQEPETVAPSEVADAQAIPARASAFALAALLALSVGLAPQIVLSALNVEANGSPTVLATEKLAQSGWEITDTPPVVWAPAFVNPSATAHIGLQQGEHRIGVFIAWYRQQNKQMKLIGSQNEVVKSEDKIWAPVERGTVRASLSGREHELRSTTLRHSEARVGAEALRLKVWHWYWIDGRIVTSDMRGKLLLALARLRAHPDDSAAVFVYAVEPAADAAVAAYLSSAGAGLSALLEAAVLPAPTFTRAYTSTP
jgi:exosortase A